MGRTEISLCMIVRDEEEHLARCLSSAASTVSEIVIVDTGSADRTVEIARSFGARVVSVPWTGDFAKARNVALDLATKPWILVLDADEEWVEPQEGKLERLLSQEGTLGYYVRLFSYVGAAGEEYVTDAVCRLFRNNPGIRYKGAIHEDVASGILAMRPGALEFSDLEIVHYGYTDRIIAQKNKSERNLTIIREALKANKDDLQLMYALGTEYYQQGQYGRALLVFETMLPKVPVYGGYTSDLLLKMAFAYRETGRRDESLRMIEETLRLYPDFTDLFELQAIVLTDLRQYPEALRSLEKAIACGDVSHQYTSCSGAGTYRSRYLSGIVYERLYRWEDACLSYEQALAWQPGYTPAWQRFAAVCAALGQQERLMAAMQAHAARLPLHAQLALLETAADAQRPEWLLQGRSLLQAAFARQPLTEGLLLAQQGDDAQAEAAWERWTGHPQHGRQALIYRWALSVKRADAAGGPDREPAEAEARRQLERLVRADGAYAALAQPAAGAALPPAVYAGARTALLRTGAWDGWLRLQEALPQPEPLGALPPALRCGLLRAPAAVQERLIGRLLASGQPETDRPGLLLAGLLALERGRSHDALGLFWAAREQADGMPEAGAAAVGVLHALTQLAARSLRGSGARLAPPMLTSEVRAVLLAE
ncbi:SPBc2 prophage-derived glycosyltransferase SunS [Paenibacillus konkukensis]|uniref:SPBc2 prophage-derived glycosyltransferase SunS n=1 Tax=Paenibacillus konkukensis TaxID=2020716 RepID=A0ABY4RRG1_9BACL|nr:glycosyltransferase [Paenibacillus konkukensis]UQZ84758.1 SPBc2 prophage-derived glycosyltransferase SunS [Paenibacillus konkukensis]